MVSEYRCVKNVRAFTVLILVVMEDGFGEERTHLTVMGMGLNPCCNGRWFRSLIRDDWGGHGES